MMPRLGTERRPARFACLLAACALVGALLLVPTGAIAAQACVQPGSGIGGTGVELGGIGGTGEPAAGGTGGTGDRAGAGGTGAVAGGIGGTGERADSGIDGTGIVGTITGFASVCIGDLEVHYDAGTPVSINGEASNLGRLALGQVVAIEAGPGAKGLSARNIAILNALEGPVTRVDAARGALEVMGQPVRLDSGVSAARFAAGMLVRVSGLRDVRGVVHATRVEAAVDLREASAVGFVRSDRGGVSLDGLRISGSAGRTGSELLVRGKWDGRYLHVRELRNDPTLPFAGRVRDVVIEGLVHGRSGRRLQISGFEVRLDAAARPNSDRIDGLAEGSRVRVIGRIESGRQIAAARVEIDRGRGGANDRTSGRDLGSESGSSAQDGDSSGGRSGDSDRRGDGGSGSGKEPSGDRGGGSGDRGVRLERVDKVERADRIDKIDRSGDRGEKAVKPESGRSGRN